MIDKKALENDVPTKQGRNGLERVLDSWDKSPTLGKRTSAFWKESKGNLPFEWKCIVTCEIGDIAGTYMSVLAQRVIEISDKLNSFLVDYSNEIGFGSGVAAGLTYAVVHTIRDAKKHGVKPSLVDALIAAGTAETGCVTAATAVPYLAGKFIGSSFGIPSFGDLLIRGGALLPALPVGLAAMSSLTFPKKSEAFRFVSEKDVLRNVAEIIKDKGHDVHVNYHSLKINGENSYVKIRERKLPITYRDDFNSNKHSLYLVTSPTVRYFPEVKRDLTTFATEFFEEAEVPYKVVENPFVHEHSYESS